MGPALRKREPREKDGLCHRKNSTDRLVKKEEASSHGDWAPKRIAQDQRFQRDYEDGVSSA